MGLLSRLHSRLLDAGKHIAGCQRQHLLAELRFFVRLQVVNEGPGLRASSIRDGRNCLHRCDFGESLTWLRGGRCLC